MNNQQFRRLVLDTPSAASRKDGPAATPRQDGATPSTLGSRMRSSIPMTPRSVAGSASIDFARQLREQNAPATNAKKFRSSAAPKGSKLASGYQDRTQLRTSTEDDDKAARVKALEDMVKLGQMEMATFEALRDEIVGGDVKDVHLVKGLDYKLLERVRRGEDVLAEKAPAVDRDDAEPKEDEVDVDEAFDDLEGKEVQPLAKEERQKKGEMAPPPPSSGGKKRTRDDILRELRESRQKAAEEKKAQQPTLGPRFKKLAAKQEKSRIERDERGREVLITVDKEGNVKRKVKKVKIEDVSANGDNGLLMPEKDAKPLGMDVSHIKKAPEPVVKEDIDIFEGVGIDYDPLGGEEDEEDDDGNSDKEDIEESTGTHEEGAGTTPDEDVVSADDSDKSSGRSPLAMPPPPVPTEASISARNYFNDTSDRDADKATAANPLTDPTILAALKKASTIKPVSSSPAPTNDAEAAKVAKRKKMLEAHDRDAEDMDLGFGSSRFEDQEEGEDRAVKLSVWGTDRGDGDGAKGESGGGGKEKRKRGGKKRKGDKNSATDVLQVMARQKDEKK
ncbi:hypothetical protein MMC26_001177 [Xylographa opegraphella]|nr:hypothetical protein [Xylographa opegraphella]